jgi:RNA polymerase sigma-70 factor (ECF subfamily)
LLSRTDRRAGSVAPRALPALDGAPRPARTRAGEAVDLPAEQLTVQRAAAGDPAALGALYQRYVDDVFGYIQLRVRDTALAEDLTHDVFLNAFAALPRFRWCGSLAPWLMRCAHNRVANHWRSQSRRPEQVAIAADDEEDARTPLLTVHEDLDEALAIHLTTREVLAAAGRLTDLQQQVVALRFGAGLSLSETAEVMDRSLNAVKNLQHHALAALRRHLPHLSDPT